MVMDIVLPCESKKICLSAGEGLWSSVSLHSDGQVAKLGADRGDILKQRLRGIVESAESRPSCGEIGGVEVSWALTLSEGHVSFYRADREAIIQLFIQDQNGQQKFELAITPADQRNWLKILNHWLK